ncbi:MAG TPA: hypothetical protein VMY34_03455, partial [Acidimicrobiales bacterium]|nr:hypothetical protein [Acidimicrobiales bacterium]
LFRVEARRWFDLAVHYPTVDAWLTRMSDGSSTSIVSDALIAQAHREMGAGESTLVVTERVGATRLVAEDGASMHQVSVQGDKPR